MKKTIALFAAGLLALSASAEETPIIEFSTSIYEQYGPSNSFTIYLGGHPGDYVDVDCGFGAVEYEITTAGFDAETQTITGTAITCTVGPEGKVKIYGENPENIDYFGAEGCYLRSVSFPSLTNLEILNLSHNELTGLDLSNFSKLMAVYLADNPYSEATPLKVGGNKPELVILEIGQSEHLDQSFNLSDYPAMLSFDAYAAHDLRKLDPTGCPDIIQISIDATRVETLDVSKNTKLRILNISDTPITSIDLSKNAALTQLFATHGGAATSHYKIKELDVTHCPELVYFFAGYNALTSIDLSKNPKLFDLSLVDNYLTDIDLSACPDLYNVNLRKNCFTFSTLPEPLATWNDYFYDQRPYALNRSYKVGDVIDFTKMLRDGTETIATVYQYNADDPSVPILIEQDAISFENGKVTLLKELPDSVYITFDNSMFALYPESTSRFVVKSAADFGADVAAVTMLPAATAGTTFEMTVGIAGATEQNPRTFSVDFGDGKPVEFSATGAGIDNGCLVSGKRAGSGSMVIYTPEGTDLTALSVKDQTLYSLDVSSAVMMRELTLFGTGLYSIDLSLLRCLTSLQLKGNHFYNFSIAGKNYNYSKTTLRDLYIPENGINNFTFDDLGSVTDIDLGGNSLSELDLTTAVSVRNIDLAGNKLEAIDLSECSELLTVDLSNNSISEFTLPGESQISTLNLAGNNLSIATLPAPAGYVQYFYAPQAEIEVPVKGPGCDLSSQYREVNGTFTQYSWFKADGSALTEGTDYTVTEGKTRWLNTDLGKVYCAMTHPAFPDFSIDTGTALMSTQTEPATMPTNVIASFTTPVGGEAVSISLASTEPNTSIFIDWKGDGIDLVGYDLGTTYTLFDATTTAGAEVKVYSYGESSPLKVFSITGATMSTVDLSKLTEAINITLVDAGLSTVTLPAVNKIQELNLGGNALSSVDLSVCTGLRTLSLNANNFSGTFDLTPFKNVELVSLSNNKLTGLTLDNPELWYLDLSGNEYETIDLSGAPRLNQLSLSGNKLIELDVESLSDLQALLIDKNRFTFKTLPPVKTSYILYVYGNQERLKAVPDGLSVDFSDQAYVNGVETTFTWFLDEPWQDEEGNWVGENLYADDEYFVNNGVVTFSQSFNNLVGLLKNTEFPKIDLFTEIFNVSGVENVAVDGKTTISVRDSDIVVSSDGNCGDVYVYSTSGLLVRRSAVTAGETRISGLGSGAYIVTAGNVAEKVIIR